MGKYHINETVTTGSFGDLGPASGELLRLRQEGWHNPHNDWRFVHKGTRNPAGSISGNGREPVEWFDPVLPASDNWEDAWLALDAIAGIWNGDEDHREYRLIVDAIKGGDVDCLRLHFTRNPDTGRVYLSWTELEAGDDPERTLEFLRMAANRTEEILRWLDGVAQRVTAKQEAVHAS